jgi:hypothetical protein
MPKQNLFLTILFADISRSTRLFEIYGDARAQEIVAKVLAALSRVALRFGGTVIKTIGDEVMCSFPRLDQAFQAACEMQECVTEDETIVDYSISIRIGFHYGNVIQDEGKDVFGDPVNVASRMVDLAKAGEIITCRQTVALLPTELRERTHPLSLVKVRGRQEEIEIFSILWQHDLAEQTMVGRSLSGEAVSTRDGREQAGPVLILQYGDETLQAGAERPLILIGREKSNDLVIKDPMNLYIGKVSRRHASIEYRNGWFVLCDHSSNGIGVHTGKGGVTFVHRGEHPLQDEGELVLGGSVSDLGTVTVLYRVKN